MKPPHLADNTRVMQQWTALTDRLVGVGGEVPGTHSGAWATAG